MNLKPILNKNLPWVHTNSEFNVLGFPRKHVKYVVHSSKRKKWQKIIFLHTSCPKLRSTSFWLQGILGVKIPSKA
jgi:hypothetical protein